ncbi:lytic transglycosylase domain-containing protein [Paenibacillus alba]|uniref:Lytic transglycosylase domain-containing protein n=1 Tax=Paenibacillus alba TaxID=1197127 RepID=A0ABU6G850_9BACL|nr:lytic transglycosylase domain-containing protein [Paenibacillus alba]MEC0230345.1 lytic transglycosylase domain-containing protein [Paenibacillus alba]
MNSTNSIDPRVMKELLQLQMLSKMSLLSGDNAASSKDDSNDFSALLETVMGQAAGAGISGQSSTDTLSSLLGNNTMNSVPSSLAALNKAYSPLQSTNSKSIATQYESIIQEACSKYGIDPSLVKAVIQQESDFNHKAVSSAGAKGLMQLMDGTGSGFGVTNPFDPHQNIDAGTHFLSSLVKKYNGNEGVALAAYNAGPGRVDRLGIKTDQDLSNKLHLLPEETQAYVSKVFNRKHNFSL